MKLIVALTIVCCLGCQDSAGSDAEIIQQLRNTQAVQQVQLDDARARIRALEMDMDRIAPHTVQAK